MADVLITRVSYDVLITRVLITRVDCTVIKFGHSFCQVLPGSVAGLCPGRVGVPAMGDNKSIHLRAKGIRISGWLLGRET